MFERYMFADYSGDPDPKKQRCCIALWHSNGNDDPRPYKADAGLDRNRLREAVIESLKEATEAGDRMVFGFDHQFSWPVDLWDAAGIDDASWRDRLAELGRGTEGRPKLGCDVNALDFAESFNKWKSGSATTGPFYLQVSSSSRLGKEIPKGWQSKRKRFRLTELDCADGFPAMELGKDRVAGQTLCGLPQLNQMIKDIEEAGLRVAFWPFDGLDVSDEAYKGKHVGVEVYPSIFPDDGWPIEGQNADDNNARDAWKTVKGVAAWDNAGELAAQMDLSQLTDGEKSQVQLEGWILGVRPHVR
ncbi:MAG: hypothetical protein H6839_02695 [Planctomycetes bacterium]|nr:hypothetical protein [Planctomycetota bacterium]